MNCKHEDRVECSFLLWQPKAHWIFQAFEDVCRVHLVQHILESNKHAWHRRNSHRVSGCWGVYTHTHTCMQREKSVRMRSFFLNAWRIYESLPEMGLDFNFSSQLLFYIACDELWFEEHFKCHDIATPFLSCQVDVTEFSLAKCLADFEIGKAPTLCWGWHGGAGVEIGVGVRVGRWCSRFRKCLIACCWRNWSIGWEWRSRVLWDDHVRFNVWKDEGERERERARWWITKKQHNTTQDRIRQDRAGQDKTRQDKSSWQMNEWWGSDKYELEKVRHSVCAFPTLILGLALGLTFILICVCLCWLPCLCAVRVHSRLLISPVPWGEMGFEVVHIEPVSILCGAQCVSERHIWLPACALGHRMV